MKFSVIVPVYNVEDYLCECLDSIANQTCQDFEVILIDDGSADGSGRICDAYARKYPEQVKVFHQENQGLLKTRARGLKIASGEIVLLVDSDDALRLDALEKICNTFDNTGCEVVIYGASRDQQFLSEAYLLDIENGYCFEGSGKRELYELMVNTGKLNSMCMKAAKKEVYDRFLNNYDTDVDICNGEDLYLSMPLVTCANKIVYLKEKLYFYRIRESSMVNSFSLNLHKSVKLVRMEMEKYLEIWGIQNCYPAFYTGVVRNWIYATKRLLQNLQKQNRKEIMSILQELSSDSFFRKSYNNMAPESLSCQHRLLATWLYQGKLRWICVVGYVFYSVKRSNKFKNQRYQHG